MAVSQKKCSESRREQNEVHAHQQRRGGCKPDETSWQREQGEPTIQVEHDADRAVDVFLDGCWMNPCVELRGVDFNGNEEALCIGGTDEDLNEEGEFIEWPELE